MLRCYDGFVVSGAAKALSLDNKLAQSNCTIVSMIPPFLDVAFKHAPLFTKLCANSLARNESL